MIKRSTKKETTQKPGLPLSENYAKLISACDEDVKLGVDVETHCKIVGSVAAELFLRINIPSIIHLFPSGFNLICAMHDVGKINPYFQEKLRRCTTGYKHNSHPALLGVDPEKEKGIGYHNEISSIALKGIVGQLIQFIVGSHHGSLPRNSYLLPTDESVGGPLWQNVRLELVEKLKTFFKEEIPEISSYEVASILAGLTCVADWIGSGPSFDSISEIDDSTMQLLISKTVEAAGFFPLEIKKNLFFCDIFDYTSPNMIQKELYDVVDSPGVYILEAQMGEGKTEAALYAAYKMLEQGKARGIYFALPTQLTSEKIYERMESFTQKILNTSNSRNSKLVHSHSWMFDMELGNEGDVGNSWFNSNKRKILAPFAVGTIDQALMAVMNVRHGFVRSFGLAGKVVILDELHTYDSFTGRILDYLIKNLQYWGCTVIILSATLSSNRITNLLFEVSNNREEDPQSNGYPLITKINEKSGISYKGFLNTDLKTYNIRIDHENAQCINEAKTRSISGEFVLWIENTVFEAQQIYREFAAWGKEVGVDVGLLHSRFEPHRRKHLEDDWVTTFGKDGYADRKKKGKVLIGTQVLEQSLDIDADFLVTHIAPIDMILQRIGRSWRHKLIDDLRPTSAKRQVVIISPTMDEIIRNPAYIFGASGYVYAPYILAKTARLFTSINQITLPSDIRTIINKVYNENNDPDYLITVKTNLRKERANLRALATRGLVLNGVTHSDYSSTRHSEINTVEVLLLEREVIDTYRYLSFSNGEKVKLPEQKELSRESKKKIAMEIMKFLIRVPSYMAPNALQEQQLNFLRPFIYISSSDEERIRVAIIEKSGSLRGYNNLPINDEYYLTYTPVIGYRAQKKEENN